MIKDPTKEVVKEELIQEMIKFGIRVPQEDYEWNIIDKFLYDNFTLYTAARNKNKIELWRVYDIKFSKKGVLSYDTKTLMLDLNRDFMNAILYNKDFDYISSKFDKIKMSKNRNKWIVDRIKFSAVSSKGMKEIMINNNLQDILNEI